MPSDVSKIKVELELAKWLQKIREEKGISQEALGVQIGKGQSDVAKIENGTKKVTVIELLLWIKTLGVPYNRLNEILKPIHEKMQGGTSLWTDE